MVKARLDHELYAGSGDVRCATAISRVKSWVSNPHFAYLNDLTQTLWIS